jgi:YVTN family beta-propeller protein
VVTISGSGFDPDALKNKISFNGIASVVKKASVTSLVTEVPLGALSGPLSVTVNSVPSNTMHFYIIPESLNPCDDVYASKSTGSSSTHDVDVADAVLINGVPRTFAYITNPDKGTVTVLNLDASLETVQIKVGERPMKIDINPQRTKAYVTNINSHDVSVIDLVPGSPGYNKEIKRIPVGIQPYGIVVTPDGKRVYVANYYSGNLSVIDTDPASGGFDHVVSNVNTGSSSRNVAVTADAGLVVVTGDFGLKIINSDPDDKEYNSVVANVSSGTRTYGVTVTPDAGLAIVTTLEGNLLVVNLYPENGDYSDAVVANVSSGTRVSNVSVSPDAMFVYVTDTDNGRILVYKIDPAGGSSANGSATSGLTLTYHNTINVGEAPEGMVIDQDGENLYVLDGGTINGTILRRVTTVKICCGPISTSKAIGDLIITIQNMINSGLINESIGRDLIKKLNTVLENLAEGKTKTALNNLNSVTNKLQSLINSRKIPASMGNELINTVNEIIGKINGSKSVYGDLLAPGDEISYEGQISKSGLGVIYPNPFGDEITINYQIANINESYGNVRISILDIHGRAVKTIIDRIVQPGWYSEVWKGEYENSSKAPDGIYFVLFRTGTFEEQKIIILSR